MVGDITVSALSQLMHFTFEWPCQLWPNSCAASNAKSLALKDRAILFPLPQLHPMTSPA
ncbi:hypothetical protein EV193_105207 [Herbihabitans rhizosphaerae]|uniref:Uncharacterized protein n=1 Tax=Herbihabitans rhizosphaerae TaxID=1872711 RepID=A0A4Q7KLW4_9PSEU|nr:hypothetical protein EV193_105207 [Herbihabitans rhizosphaerae]